MKIAAALASLALVAALALDLPAQDRKIGNIHDAKFKYEPELKKIPGVKSVSIAGVDGEERIVVIVDTEETRIAVFKLAGGTTLDGHALKVMVTKSTEKPAVPDSPGSPGTDDAEPDDCRCRCHRGPGRTVADPATPVEEPDKIDMKRLDDLEYQREQCDFMREWTGKPPRKGARVKCLQMVGWTNDPAKIAWVKSNGLPWWPSKEMPMLPGSGGDGMICYTYVKHRQFCPLGMKEVLKGIDRLTPGK